MKVVTALGLALCLMSLLGLGACASTRPGIPGSALEPTFGQRIMVTLPTTVPFLVRRSIQELVAAYDLRFVASWNIRSLDQHCVVFELSDPSRADRLLGSLSRDHRVDLAQPVQRFVLQSGAEGPRSSESASYRRFQSAADVLRLDEAHRHATGRGVRLAMIDTGADLGHPEYRDRVVAVGDFAGSESGSFTSDLHGTAVAGLIASSRDDDTGIVGVAPDVDLLVLKACWPDPPGSRRAVCDSYTLALALDFAMSKEARVINLSLGGPEDPILRRMLEVAMARGDVIVAALPASPPGFPASIPGVLAVRPLPRSGDDDMAPAPETRWRRSDVLAAPGEEVLTTTPGGGFDFWSGSSMAAAQVSGVAALVLQLQPGLTAADLAELLRATARDNPGHSVVDACAAIASAAGATCP